MAHDQSGPDSSGVEEESGHPRVKVRVFKPLKIDDDEPVAAESETPSVKDDEAVTEEDTARLQQEAGTPEPPPNSFRPRDLLMTNKKGEPLSNIANAMTMLTHDPELDGCFQYDLMELDSVLVRRLPGEQPPFEFPRKLSDVDISLVQVYLQRHGLTQIGKTAVGDAIEAIARESAYHPIRDYFSSLTWDGVNRLDSFAHVYLGCADTQYNNTIGRLLWLQIVARIYRPGSQCDHMCILEGDQGAGKSSALAIIGGKWFSNHLPSSVIDKDFSQHIKGKMLIEVAELEAMNKADTNAFKGVITRRVEKYRRSFGRKESVEPRQCTFAGSTNAKVYLKDSTGGRRFWPIQTGRIRRDLLDRDRDQLFAEAVLAFKEGAKWWPDEEFEKTYIAAEQEARRIVDPW
jgi:hypothetical protein